MKDALSQFLLCCILTLFCQAALSAQNETRLSARFDGAPLTSALQQLEKNYDLSFSYDEEAVKGIRLDVQFTNLPLRDALQRLFAGTGLSFDILDNRYVLILKNPEQERSSPTPPPMFAICGKILDKETGEALPGATAYIKNSPQGTTTDAGGNFSLTGNFQKTDTLEISFLGYERQQHPARALLDQPCATYRLALATQWMPDVVIRDFAVDMLSLGTRDEIVFKKEKMPTLPGWGEPDVLRMLQLLPGIGSADESASRLNVRGGTPDQNLVLWDGIPIYHTGHFFGLYDAFNPYVVEEVNVWRGNFGAEYGGRNSSVIDIKGKPGFAEERTWGLGMNLLSLQGFWEKPLKKNKMSLLVAFRRSYTDLIQSQTYRNLFNQIFQNGRVALQEQQQQNNDFFTWEPLFAYGDFNLKLRWKGKRQRESAVSIYSGSDRLDYRFAYDDSTNFAATKDYIEAQNFGVSWQHWAQWSPQFRVKYKIALSIYENDYFFQWNDDWERPYVYRWDTNNKMGDLSAQFHHTWQVSDKHEMSFGYQLSAQEASLVYRDTNTIALTGNTWTNDTTRSGLHTFYAEFSYRANPRFDFTLGIRENHFPARGLYYSEPRVSFRWKPFGMRKEGAGDFTLKGSFGRHWQFVFQIIDFGDLGIGEPLWAISDDDIPAQELWQWALGASYERKSLLIDLEFYTKNYRNLTSLNLRVDRGFERPWAFDGKSTARGLDFLLRKRWQAYSLWVAYSAGEVMQSFPNFNGGLPYPARHDIRQRLNFVNMLSLKRWDFSANLQLRGGSPYSKPSVVQMPCPACSADSLTYALDFDRLNGERLPGSVRLDVGITYRFGKPGWKGKAGLSIYNFFNRQILLDKDFILEKPPTDQPQTWYNLRELNRLAAGATPNLYVQFEW
jgi:hypothetical protein